jgi:hypothetical protein
MNTVHDEDDEDDEDDKANENDGAGGQAEAYRKGGVEQAHGLPLPRQGRRGPGARSTARRTRSTCLYISIRRHSVRWIM